jgi:hypothetical protein
MNIAPSDRVINLVFAISCLALVGISAARYWPSDDGVHAREDFVPRGSADPFGIPADVGGPVAFVFISSDCPACADSLPFYKRLADGVARARRVVFVSMEPEKGLSAYLQTGGVGSPRVVSVMTPPRGIPGTPCILVLDESRRVARSWAGRLSRAQERDVERLIFGT